MDLSDRLTLLATAATLTLAAATGPVAAADTQAARGQTQTRPASAGSPVDDTMYTTRLPGATPADEAIAVTRHTFTAAFPPDSKGEGDDPADRPRAVILVDPGDEVAAISAAELIHFPDDAPILFTNGADLSAATKAEIQRLHPVGVDRGDGVQVFLVGKAASGAVPGDVQAMGFKVKSITGSNEFDLADKVDAAYGAIEDGDSGVPTMMTSAAGGGNGVADVFVGSVDAPDMMLPAAEWCAHMPAGVLWVDGKSDTLPQPTINALKRRNGHATIYVMGGPDVVSAKLFRSLQAYGSVGRVTNDDGIASNAPLKDTPVAQSVAFARMWDPVGLMGWNITGPGHGFILANAKDWQGAVAASVMSGVGFHAPLVLTDSATALPKPVEQYFAIVRPNFLVTPAAGPYNMVYVIGDADKVSWPLQARVNASMEMANRHDAPNGSLYHAPR